MSPFKPGDIVVLKSGSCKMVLVKIVEEMAEVTFMPKFGKSVVTQLIPLISLTYAT